ncbi:hypothetical protein AAFF_G00406550 [Aldrovandia affinis]|uniref:Uncharacterized protein n=1 Tax=Aldrovandia affinis TaxID=143900 RepID=A0AAD7SCE0_9TELE|nr:hypothetical protein AAFF_G00406550 [Aldrovandia affinis]
MPTTTPTTRLMSVSQKSGRKATPAVEIPVYDPNVPEPTCREDLLKYWINLSLDEKLPRRCCGCQRVVPRWLVWFRRFVPTWTDQRDMSSHHSYHAWHKGRFVEVTGVPYCSTLGVYVDQPAGIINFYLIESKQEGEEDTDKKEVKLIRKFQSPMEERIVPGIWVGRSSTCWILKKDWERE